MQMIKQPPPLSKTKNKTGTQRATNKKQQYLYQDLKPAML